MKHVLRLLLGPWHVPETESAGLTQLWIAVVWLLLAPDLAFAQTGSLSGTITDGETGEPLPDANILVLELSSGAATDIDGNYSIMDIPVGTYTLRVSYLGYKTTEESIAIQAGTNTRNVALETDFQGLEGVVVTGIASATSKARAEVAVSRIDAPQALEQNAYSDLAQLINGKVSGVSVQPSSGNIGGGIRFVMRSSTGLNGLGQPIVYVDGIRVDAAEVTGISVGGQGTSMLAMLNPEDIEAIYILKGPAGAALYGTRGSNGVILIKTKRGSLAGGGMVPFNVTYQGLHGVNEQARKYNVFNAGAPDEANAFFRTGTILQHTVSASGGSDIVRFFTS